MANEKQQLLFYIREIIDRLQNAECGFPYSEIEVLVARAEELRKAAGYASEDDDWPAFRLEYPSNEAPGPYEYYSSDGSESPVPWGLIISDPISEITECLFLNRPNEPGEALEPPETERALIRFRRWERAIQNDLTSSGAGADGASEVVEESTETDQAIVHSRDLATVNRRGTPYTFTKSQAAGVEIHSEESRKGRPVIGGNRYVGRSAPHKAEWLRNVHDAGMRFAAACRRCQRYGSDEFWKVLVGEAFRLADLLEQWTCLPQGRTTWGPEDFETLDALPDWYANRERVLFLLNDLAAGHADRVKKTFLAVLGDVGLCMTERFEVRLAHQNARTIRLLPVRESSCEPLATLAIWHMNRSDRIDGDRVNALECAIDDLEREFVGVLEAEASPSTADMASEVGDTNGSDKATAHTAPQSNTPKETGKNSQRHKWDGVALDAAEAFKKHRDDGGTQSRLDFLGEYVKEHGIDAKPATLNEKLKTHREKWDPDQKYGRSKSR